MNCLSCLIALFIISVTVSLLCLIVLVNGIAKALDNNDKTHKDLESRIGELEEII